ncbi:MAG TPA: FAD-binding and (Fe-S)-binding domain-containing protein [Burkholderiales bacterium]|nr:FAD-binding and (Fe-S)-binding domain-containing protein [Burkholderiales bacterium]
MKDAGRSALEKALSDSIEGEVRFDAGSRALYATDASNYRQVPIGVVVPKSIADVEKTVEFCHEFGAPVLSRGGGTSLCGQCCNVAIVIDFSKYLNRVLEIDREQRIARVQPGCVLDDLRDAATKHGLTFAPDPATHTHNTLGGMIGNNSCGPHSVMGGMTADNVIALDVLTYDGTRMTVGQVSQAEYESILAAGGRRAEIYRALRDLAARYAPLIRERFPAIPRRVSGYNLPALLPENGFDVARALVGSESTCAVTLEAKLRLVPNPPCRALLVLGYPDVYCAGDHVPEVLEFGPIALEGMDDRLIEDMTAVHLHPRDVKLLPEGRGWLMVEFGGDTRDEARDRAKRAMAALAKRRDAPRMKLFGDPGEEACIWRVREAGLGATAHVPDKPVTWEGWEDSSVPPEKLGEYLRKLRALFEQYDYGCDLYGHFGQGCVHTRIDFDLETAAGIDKFRRFLRDAATLAVSLGGSVSGEHGDGQSKAELLPIMFGDELIQALREFKRIWDPDLKMNPGKVVDAYRADQNLRLGTSYSPPVLETRFKFPADAGNFSRTLLRCVGVGECRKKGGTMCPSYMATREEQHSTRGRARLLFEMSKGEVLQGGWGEQAVYDALHLCLSCKGCKGECPVHVDMATYKAEFLSHYYERHARPFAAQVFGRIDRVARFASHFARAGNFFMRSAPFAGIAKRVLGVARERELPPFARASFVSSLRDRRSHGAGAPRLILWPDTFNNYFHPATAHAALALLEHAGYAVDVPRSHVCCGRPLYEWGFVDEARRYLRDMMTRFERDIRDGTRIVVLEPACASVFRDELTDLFPDDEQAKRLSRQVVLLSELMASEPQRFPPAHLTRRAIVHAHCHHKAVLKTDALAHALDNLGLDYTLLDSGCCGMAGSFGFEADKYEVSIACAERVLAPAVREARDDTLVIANGFSCREQIRQLTGRRALHLADVCKLALDARHSACG